MKSLDPVSLEIFKHLFASVAEEMGVTICRTGYSPNIKERRDYSCALFDPLGNMIAQAAHIPVHLGAMPASVASTLEIFPRLDEADVVILNDPFLGGSHLPDITLISPVYLDGELLGYVASRAHHADVGGMAPGSMPIAVEIFQEGLILPPVKLVEGGRMQPGILDIICRNSRTPDERRGDINAQVAAHRVGERRFQELAASYGAGEVQAAACALMDYSERLTREAVSRLPEGRYTFEDFLDDDGFSDVPVRIRASIQVLEDTLTVDFSGTSAQTRGPVNCVFAVTLSSVLYVLRSVSDPGIPANAGCLRPLEVLAPSGTVVNPRPPAAVAGGNTETTQRIVDVLLGALAGAIPDRIPAASQGTANNLSLGGWDPRRKRTFAYYETIGGGMGGGPRGPGFSGKHVHMTNTLNTPVEALEFDLPVRVEEYALRKGSAGRGKHSGGEGIRRSLRFLAPATVTVLSERRKLAPYGLAGGRSGKQGANRLLRAEGSEEDVGAKATFDVKAGDLLVIETPGGGGWGSPEDSPGPG